MGGYTLREPEVAQAQAPCVLGSYGRPLVNLVLRGFEAKYMLEMPAVSRMREPTC